MHIVTEQHIGVKNRRINNKSILAKNVITIVYIDPNIIKSIPGGDRIQRTIDIKHKSTVGKNVITQIIVSMTPTIIPAMPPSTGTKSITQDAEKCGIINIPHINIKIQQGGHIGIKRALKDTNRIIKIPITKSNGQTIGNNNHESGKNSIPTVEYIIHSPTPTNQWTTTSIIAIIVLIIDTTINNAAHNIQRHGPA